MAQLVDDDVDGDDTQHSVGRPDHHGKGSSDSAAADEEDPVEDEGWRAV